MSKNTQHDNQSILFQIEDNYGVPSTISLTAMIPVDEFDMDAYTGSEETLETFCKKGGARARTQLMSNQHSTMSFGMPMTFPTTAGNLPAWSAVARACNLDAILQTGSVLFRPSATGTADSGTLRRLMEFDSAADHAYVSTGCRGQLDLTLEHLKRPRLSVSSMMGSYNRPELTSIVNLDCENLVAGIAENLVGALVNEISLDGHNLCVKKVTIKNIGGVSLSRDGFMCPGGEQTMLEEVQTTIDIEFENSNWDTEFNPYELAEAHAGVSTVPFKFDHGTAGSGLKFECLKVQPTKPKTIKTTGGRKGITLELLCIGTPELTIY